MSTDRAAAFDTRPSAALDRLAAVAVLLAAGPIALMGIGHPASHATVLAVLCVFGWINLGADRPAVPTARLLGLGWPGGGRFWIWIVAAGCGSALVKWWLDLHVLDGRGGLAFYRLLFEQQGVTTLDGTVRWALLAGLALVLIVVILIDGMFFTGLIQQRLAAHANVHAGVHGQAVLFGLPHAFAGPAPDPLYGVFAYLAGLAYGYVYEYTRSHWLAAMLLWSHVVGVWLLMLLV